MGQLCVKIVGSRGNNLHEVSTSSGDTFLVSMPTKFRKNIWIKRGNKIIILLFLKLCLLNIRSVNVSYYKFSFSDILINADC